MSKQSSDDRLLARDGFKHFRRSYSVAEAQWGLIVGLVLIAVASWVYWKGQHPDPGLFAAPPLVGTAAGGAAGRGPLPLGLATAGWTEGEIAEFDVDNLYVKINGRADYFIGFGFERLHFLSLRSGTEDDAPSVEVEVYKLGSAANALGAFSGERKSGGQVIESVGGVRHLSRNALFLARGVYYVRVIGSEESPAVTAQLEHVAAVFEKNIAGGERPWAYVLLGDGAGVAADRLDYMPKNAFSIEGVGDLYVGRLADDTQLFVAVRSDASAAKALAEALVAGFSETGDSSEGSEDSAGWVLDRYVATYASAAGEDRFVLGVRGGTDLARAKAHLASLRAALAALPAQLRDRATAAPAPSGAEPQAPVAPDSNQPAGEPTPGSGPEIDLAPGDDRAGELEPGSTEEM